MLILTDLVDKYSSVCCQTSSIKQDLKFLPVFAMIFTFVGQELLRKGAAVNARGFGSYTPLMFAVYAEKPRIVQALLASGKNLLCSLI